MKPRCFGILADKPPVLRQSWSIQPRCFYILVDKPTVLNPNFFPPMVWTYPDGAQGVGALRLAAARPCHLRVPQDCVAEWRSMSRKQKNSSQDPPPRKVRSNIWLKKNSDLRHKYLCEPVRRPGEFETRDNRGELWRRFCRMETSFLILITLVSN